MRVGTRCVSNPGQEGFALYAKALICVLSKKTSPHSCVQEGRCRGCNKLIQIDVDS